MQNAGAKAVAELDLAYFEKCRCWMTPRACGLRYIRASQSQGKVFYDDQDEIISFRDCLDCEVGRENAKTVIDEKTVPKNLEIVIKRGRKKRGPRKKRISFHDKAREMGHKTEAEMFRALKERGMTQRGMAELLGCSRYVVETRCQQYLPYSGRSKKMNSNSQTDLEG